MRFKAIYLVFALFCLFLLNGCATIVHGDSQYIEVDSKPAGASAYINGSYFITPAKVLLKRGYPTYEYQVLVQKEGYKPGYARITQRLSGWLWGDIFWGILPGLVVDSLTGGGFNLIPARIEVVLEPSAK